MDVGQFDLMDRSIDRKPLKPVFAAPGFKSEKGFLKYFYDALPVLEQINEPQIRRCYNNLMWYTGEYDGNTEHQLMIPGRRAVTLPRYMVPVVINHLYDLTEQRTSRLASYKPDFDTYPQTEEEEDRISARHMKTLIESVRRQNRFDMLLGEAERWNMVFGYVYLMVEWDEGMGSRPDTGPNKDKAIGDVRISIKEPYWVMLEPKRDYKKVNYLFEIHEILHVEEARKKYKMNNLEPDKTTAIWSFSQDSACEKDENEMVIYRFMYKPNDYLPDGMEALVAGGKVVDMTTDGWKYSHKDFPHERHTDIDVPGRIFPASTYNNLIPIQHQYNKMTSLVNRNISLAAHPKWFMQKGTCDIKSLGNTATVVQTSPNAPFPNLVTFGSVPQEVFQYRDTLREEMGIIGAIQGVSRGDPPANARAASMLKFYEEQETQRNGTVIDKHNDLIQRVYSKVGAVVQDKYPDTPERIVRLLGRNNRYDIVKLSEVKIASPYDVQIQNSTGFSESKAGRIEEIGFLMEKCPGTLTNEQIVDILGIGQPQKFYDVVTAALKEAECENQEFFDGHPVGAPEPWEDHITHRRTHLIWMQNYAFRRLPKWIRNNAVEHVKFHEMGMFELAQKSPQFSQQLLNIPDFPRFATPEVLPAGAAPSGAQASGGAGGNQPAKAPPKSDSGAAKGDPSQDQTQGAGADTGQQGMTTTELQ